MQHEARSYLVKTAVIIGVFGIGFAVMHFAYRLFDQPLVPGIVAGGVIALWIQVLKRLNPYGDRP
jgi:hypothetical protein